MACSFAPGSDDIKADGGEMRMSWDGLNSRRTREVYRGGSGGG